jgi:hypothetical protein
MLLLFENMRTIVVTMCERIYFRSFDEESDRSPLPARSYNFFRIVVPSEPTYF